MAFFLGSSRNRVGNVWAFPFIPPFTKIPPDPPFPKGGTRADVIQFTSYQPILPTPFHEGPLLKGLNGYGVNPAACHVAREL